MTDDTWAVIKKYQSEVAGRPVPDDLRSRLDEVAEVTTFDGGVFIAMGAEFDLFVEEHRQGRWNVRKEITQYLKARAAKYGTLVVTIYESNVKSLRLAHFFKFIEVSRENGKIRMESTSWAT
jgi:hypothetical protein